MSVSISSYSTNRISERLHHPRTHLYEIYLSKVVKVGGTQDVEYRYNIFVAEVAQELDLAESTQTEHGMVERRDALDCYSALRWVVHRGSVANKSANVG